MILDEIRREQEKIVQENQAIQTGLIAAESRITELKSRQAVLDRKKYELTLYECHVREIFRVAEAQFNRLKSQTKLTPEDVAELEKWIGRAKSSDGLKSILDALEELGKYYPHEIKGNLYALTQRIIIGGPYRRKLKRG